MTQFQHGEVKRLAAGYSANTRGIQGKKSTLVAYALLVIGGPLALHRFYLGATGTGLLLLVITLASTTLFVVGVGLLGLLVVAGWVIIDIFLIPGMTSDYNRMVDEHARDGRHLP